MKRYEFENYHNWHDRGYIPHYEAKDKYQLITYRLADSLPKEVMKKISGGSLDYSGAPLSDAAKKKALERRQYIETCLDNGFGSCLLSEPVLAQKVIESWQFFNKQKYDLIAYVVMPNHVHLLIKVYENQALGNLVRSWKLFTTNFVLNHSELREKFLRSYTCAASESGAPRFSIWQREYWDRFIRDERYFQQAITYIHNNPVKAGLVTQAKDWPWSSIST